VNLKCEIGFSERTSNKDTYLYHVHGGGCTVVENTRHTSKKLDIKVTAFLSQ